MNIRILLILFLCPLFIGDRPILPQNSQQNNEKLKLNQLTQTKDNQLELITYIELHGKPNSRFGFSVAGICDINLDGNDDVIVGNGYKGSGEALIFLGGAVMDSIPDIIMRWI